MKTIKNAFFGGALNVVTKVNEVKGNHNEVTLKVYLTANGNKKIWLPKNVVETTLGYRLDSKEAIDKFTEEWRANFFLDGVRPDYGASIYEGEECHLIQNGRRGSWHFRLRYIAKNSEEAKWYVATGEIANANEDGFLICGINVERDYYTINISRDEFVNGVVALKLIKNNAHRTYNRLHDENETFIHTVFEVRGSEANVSGQRKANCCGFNAEVECYLLNMKGLRGLPKFDTRAEYEKWYNTLTQNVADGVRSDAMNFYTFGAGAGATKKQIAFIKKNCLDLANEHGGLEGITKGMASAIIDTFINYKVA